jgi:hypothetical protein
LGILFLFPKSFLEIKMILEIEVSSVRTSHLGQQHKLH